MPPLNTNRWTTDPKYIDLLNFLIERTENVESPINIKKLVREFKEKSGTSQTLTCLKSRVERMRTIIHGFKHIDTNTKVKLMIALSASVNADFLEELKKNASVEVDEKNRITKYKSIDWSLELRGNHSKSEKMKIAMREIELKRNYRKLISDYFENDDDADTFPKKKDEKEMWNLIEFITRKCGTVDSPLSIGQLTKDFNKHFGILRTFDCIYRRVKAYCNEIQRIESLDTLTKIKQLFCLSARLDSDFLQELRKDAVVEVDHQNRITKYTANNGRFSLHGDHSQSAKSKLTWSEKRKNKNAVKKHCISGVDEKKESEKDNRYSENNKDEYSSEESGSELHSENEDDHSNYSIDDPPRVKLEPFRGSIQEDMNEIEGDEDIQQIPKPLQSHGKYNQVEGVPIKVEHEEPVEIKPEASHNSKIKFFEAMHSLIVCLDTPSLSWIQSKIHQKIHELLERDDVMLNNEISQIIDLSIARMTNHSVGNLSENVESVNLSYFLCYLKAVILNSKISSVEGLVKNISELIEESQNKRIPMEKVANALRTTLDIDGF